MPLAAWVGPLQYTDRHDGPLRTNREETRGGGARFMSSRAARSIALLRAASSALAAQHAPPSRVRCALEAASVLLPHPDKAATGGEDAAFCGDSVFGVFDGVGGWAKRGVDAGAFSRRLAASTQDQLTRQPKLDLDAALDRGLRDVTVLGSCTACLVRIDRRQGVLSALNLGDSGWRLLRPDGRKLRVEAASTAQQHYFNVRRGPDQATRPAPRTPPSLGARAPHASAAHPPPC